MNYTNTLFFLDSQQQSYQHMLCGKLSMIFTVLLMGLNATAGAEDALVDKPVKYGEKYLYAITTTEQKSYTLDIEWKK